MKIYLINGYTDNIGLWEVALFTDKEKAISEFKTYVHRYHAEVSEYDEWVAFCDEGHFYLEEREV